MSYWIYLNGPKGPVAVDHFIEGGTLSVQGSHFAEVNVTYNYARHFKFKELNGLVAGDTIPLLSEAVARLGTERDMDYWQPTEGNAGAACELLLAWAMANPLAVWLVR
jgi:hypothetical protein